MRYAIVILLMAVFCQTVFAQRQNDNWCFGVKSGINFSTIPPTTFSSNISSLESCAAVSNRRTGKLLFYTDGVYVWNAKHNKMYNADSIGTDYQGDCAQGSVIVPVPGDSNNYYIFTLENSNSFSPHGYLRYSIVNMTLDDSLGDIYTHQKAILLDSNFTEAMTTINVCNTVWLALIKRGTNAFYLYNISSSGIDPVPVISPKGYIHGSDGTSIMKVSRDNQKLAVTTYNGYSGVSYLALHDLDFRTGTVSNGIIIDSAKKLEFYGCEFSPDGKKLYATLYNSKQVCQYDLSSDDPATIKNSKKIIYSSPTVHKTIGAPQLGPDNNIYIPFANGYYLDKITNANLASPGCVYVENALPLQIFTKVWLTVPQLVNYPGAGPIVSTKRRDTIVCNIPQITLKASPNHQTYLWSDNTTADNITVAETGKYWVKFVDSCFEHTDTFRVTVLPILNLDLGNDTAICVDASVILKSKFPYIKGINYSWSTGSTDTIISVSDIGKYWLTLTTGNCIITDTINITRKPSPVVDIGKDTTVCPGDNIVLTCNPQPTNVAYSWNNGATTNSIITNGPGQYVLTVNDNTCKTSDSMYLGNFVLPYIELGNDTLLCENKYLALPESFIKGTGYSFLWNNGSTDSVFNVEREGFYAVKLTNICGTAYDSIQVKYHSCSIWLPTAFSPNGNGLNDKLKLVGDVNGVSRFSLMIYNRWGQNVFHTNDVFQGWDGRFKDQEVAAGTYYYLLRVIYRGREQSWKGDVTIIR